VSDAKARAFQRNRLKKEQKKAADALITAALEAYNARRFTEAQFLCGEILTFLPEHFDALHLLGVSQLDSGQKEEAEATLRRALAVDPKSAEAHCNHGVALFDLKRYEDACRAYERAIALQPRYPVALNNLGNAWKHLFKFDQAVAHYKKALALEPRYVEAWANYGMTLVVDGKFTEGEACFREALRLDPRCVEALVGQGLVEMSRRHGPQALACFDAALRIRPRSPEALAHRASVHMGVGNIEAAGRDAEAALALAPTQPTALLVGAEVAQYLSNTALAESLAERVLIEEPRSERAHAMIGACRAARGDIAGAIEMFDKALAITPNYEVALSKKIFAMDFLPGADFAAHQRARKEWWLQIGSRLDRCSLGGIDPDPERRLRIGYVSSDLRGHSAGLTVLSIFANHDHRQFEIFAYACSEKKDQVTELFKGHADHWIEADAMSDQELTERILADRIDILVDMSGHTSGNRLGVFSRKPAPIQVSAWGHGSGTGIPLVDYIFNDRIAIPEEARPLHAEVVADLPCLITMTPPELPVGPLPMLTKGYPTFGVFNRIDKISDEAIALWARIFAAIPQARLVVKHGALADPKVGEVLMQRFVAAGFAAERVMLQGPSPRHEHLRAFDDIDISLDPFPQNGGVSTWESLYLGVPVIARLGNTSASRAAASILTSVGLTDFVAADDDAYVAIAQRFAAAPDELAALRAGLPARIAASEAGDTPRYTRAVETWYRRFWRDYCASRASSTA
jgi:predicted O-linked N-acetylglucosamine transferase (SPINDLY family)